jgi:hypothetical protein
MPDSSTGRVLPSAHSTSIASQVLPERAVENSQMADLSRLRQRRGFAVSAIATWNEICSPSDSPDLHIDLVFPIMILGEELRAHVDDEVSEGALAGRLLEEIQQLRHGERGGTGELKTVEVPGKLCLGGQMALRRIGKDGHCRERHSIRLTHPPRTRSSQLQRAVRMTARFATFNKTVIGFLPSMDDRAALARIGNR